MKIQIMQIFKESFKHVWSHMLEWLRVAFAPIIIFCSGLFVLFMFSIAGGVVSSGLTTNNIPAEGLTPGGYFLLGLGILVFSVTFVVGIVNLAINGLRYGVLSEGGKRWWTLRLDWRFWKLLVYYLLISVLTVIYALIAVGIVMGAESLFNSVVLNVILGTLFALFGIYLMIRIGLTFLLIAIDQKKPLRRSWHLLKSNILRFFWLVFFVSITITIITMIGSVLLSLLGMLLGYVNTSLGDAVSIPSFLWSVFIWFINWAVISKATAGVYKTFTEGTVF